MFRQTRGRALQVLAALALVATPLGLQAMGQEDARERPGRVVVRDGNGSIGVFAGGASGFIGGTGPNGFEGVYVGPDGRVSTRPQARRHHPAGRRDGPGRV